MLIRSARPEDAEHIGSIRVAAWQAGYRALLPAAYLAALDPGANLDGLRAALRADTPPFTLRIAEIDGQPIAFSILGKPRYDAEQSVAELWALNVHPAYWRKGAGQGLVRQAILDAREQQFAHLELWCMCDNPAARRLYESCGFVPNGQVRTIDALTGYPLHELAYALVL
ncbi:MAG: N-acetyltransferase [Proteobacteria bacterium]|nr:N-acetyltransferase [Pseudomonadota bacterium]